MSTSRCPQCGTHSPAENTFCSNCGSALDSPIARPRRRKWWDNTLVGFVTIGAFLALVALVGIGVAGQGDRDPPVAKATAPAPTPEATSPLSPAPTTATPELTSSASGWTLGPDVTPAYPTREPVVQSVPGLDLSRSEIQESFEKFGFRFESFPLVDGTPRSLALSPESVAMVEITGPSDSPSSATILIESEHYKAVGYHDRFVITMFDEWGEVLNWLDLNLPRLINSGGGEAHAIFEGCTVKLEYFDAI